ncbi:BPSL0761 family protein [Geopseudomonas aromaticivorans]
MTMPHERLRSINQTRDFLASLLRNPDVPEAVRAEARYLLRHYPGESDMQLVIEGEEILATAGLRTPLFASEGG